MLLLLIHVRTSSLNVTRCLPVAYCTVCIVLSKHAHDGIIVLNKYHYMYNSLMTIEQLPLTHATLHLTHSQHYSRTNYCLYTYDHMKSIGVHG
jgi:hypothetical protein